MKEDLVMNDHTLRHRVTADAVVAGLTCQKQVLGRLAAARSATGTSLLRPFLIIRIA